MSIIKKEEKKKKRFLPIFDVENDFENQNSSIFDHQYHKEPKV